MQQPNQSPPGCNPYAVNNKGIAHLLLILLLVAGLSVVGMFLFKMVSGGGLDVMGARIASNETSCNVWAPQSVSCTGNYRIRDCTYAGRQGKQCYLYSDPIGTGWGPWDKADCRDTRPLNCPSGMTQVEDCISRFNRDPNITRSGWRCKLNSQPSGDWNYANCRLTPILNCDAGYEPADDCRQPRDKMYGDVGDGPFYRTGYRCRPISSQESQCVQSRPNCPAGYGVEGCTGRTVGPAPAPFEGYKCVKRPDEKPNPPIVKPQRCLTTNNACVYNPNNTYSGCCSAGHVMVGAGCDVGRVKCVDIKNPPTPLPTCSLSSQCSASTKCCGNASVPSSVYTMVSCKYYDGSSLRDGNRCVTTPATPPVTPPVTNTCIPEWGRGTPGQSCCTSGNTFSVDAGYNYKMCYPNRAGMCHDKNECTTTSGISCCTGYTASSCGNGAFKCTPTPPKKPNDIDGDGIPNDYDPDVDGDNRPDPAQTPTSNVSGGTTPPPTNECRTCVTASGSFKTMEGKPVNGAAVIVYLGDGSTAGTTKTDASGNYSLRFDKKGINFAIRSVSTSYKPAKPSYPECNNMSAIGYENCWFKPQIMSGVDFVATQAARVYKAPTAEFAQVSAASTIKKGDTVSTVVYAKSEHSRIKKVTLYLNPAYSPYPRCQSEAIGALELYGLKDRWVKVGEKVYSDAEAVASGFTTINWSTVSNFGLAVPCSLQDGTDQYSTCKNSAYYLTVNVEDMGGVTGTGTSIAKNPTIPVMRCTGNPLGHRACGSTYYDASCGKESWSRIDIRPTGSDVPTPVVRNATIRAVGTPAGGVYPLMVLKSGTTEIKRWYVTGQFADYVANVGNASIANLSVHFINDSETNGSRNLRVDYLKLGNTVYQTEASSTKSLGSWSSATKCAEGFKSSEWLHCNGYFQYMAIQPR